QDAQWRESVLPKGLPRVAVEAGATAGWYKYVGLEGAVVGIESFGDSAPADQLFKHFGLTAEHVAAAVEQVLKYRRSRNDDSRGDQWLRAYRAQYSACPLR